MMRFKVATIFSLAAYALSPVFAEEPAPAAAPKDDPALEAEISYVEALVNNGYPDIAGPVIEATKKKWPQSEVRFFAIEVRGILALGKFEEAEKKIAALPDRKSTKYWAARLEMANNYFGRGQKPECMKIYDEFFKVFQKPPADIRKFYMNACYAYGQLLVGDKQYAKAAQRYEALLAQVATGEDQWCNLACETVEIYLRLADGLKDPAKVKQRDDYLAKATKIVDKLLWQLDKPVFFGRAVSMKAHIEQIRGDIAKASQIITDYKPQLQELHDQILQFDPEGKMGLVKQSPLPECLYLQAKMMWDEAQEEAKKAKRDNDKIIVLMFGPKGPNGKRVTSKGCFAMAQNVFLNYETSAWAPAAGELAEQVRVFTKKAYNKEVKTKVTAAQIAKVRAAQFKEADEKFGAGQYQEAIAAYMGVLAKFPELPESIRAIENVVSSYLDLMIETKDKALKAECRENADVIEGYLAERFAGAKDKLMMTTAGDAVIRLAAKESERRNTAAADRIYTAFFTNYRDHSSAATLAAAKAMELQKAGKISEAIRYWSIISTVYSNSTFYATSLVQLSQCYGKLGDTEKEIACMTAYVAAEKVKIRQLQAQFQLAQMYQRNGMELLASAETNAADKVEAIEAAGTAQIEKAIASFGGFMSAVDEALKNPATAKDDAAKYKELKEASMFMIGECWARMNRPEDKLPTYRANAAKAYEDYVATFPGGKYAKTGYVKLGTIYTALGDMAKSKDALDRLSKKFPDSDEAKNAKPRLAKSLIEMGLKREGAEIYSEMLRTDGSYTAQQFVNAGDALIDGKNWDLANQAFEKAIRVAGTNVPTVVAKAKLGLVRSAWKQGSLMEAHEALRAFLDDPKFSKMAIAADANFMLVDIASEQGQSEKDNVQRGKYFGAAIGALKKVRQYWKNKPRAEQDRLDLLSGDVLVRRMKAEEAMGLKEEAKETCGRAASTFQVFLQAHGVTPEHPLEKMDEGEVANLERAYATMVPLFSQLGADQADRVMKFGQEYLDLFPEGKARTEVENCMNRAKADMPAK